jgi:deazaflavin-dependent oxidoreductase (nitroreductase family)
VPGRKSGLPRTTPVALGEGDGQRWLVANFGEVDWVRNLRAAGRGTLTRGHHSEEVFSMELPPALAAPLLRQSLAAAPPPIRKNFGVKPDSSLEDLEREVERHPVFQILPVREAANHPVP